MPKIRINFIESGYYELNKTSKLLENKKQSGNLSETELKQVQDIVDKLNINSRDYKLTIQNIPVDYYIKIQTLISAKQAPDLMWLSQQRVN